MNQMVIINGVSHFVDEVDGWALTAELEFDPLDGKPYLKVEREMRCRFKQMAHVELTPALYPFPFSWEIYFPDVDGNDAYPNKIQKCVSCFQDIDEDDNT